ncbi:MAG: carboxypeptidase regulatory-like domain-containing protein [Planctomycetes bacterium]|nr:carboxypeptidase regulatory-like domain-containing protein [Planctomycetota bacterium]
MLVGALVVCAVIVAAVALVLRDGERAAPDPRTAAQASPSSRVEGAPLEPALERDSRAADAGRPSPAVSPSFDGRGRIHGELVAGPGTVLPQRWTLVLEGSPMLQGRERAALRRIDFERGETTFDVPDLPLAGYRVRAEAPGLNGPPADVLLVTTSSAAFVTLTFAPAGFLDGQVRLASGAPAEGLRVTLESSTSRARTALDCDVNGAFVFRGVVDGEYRLHYGPPEAPLLPARQLLFRAPSLRVPEAVLPELTGLRVTVLDESKAKVPGAVLTGTSDNGGAFEVTADASGLAHARFLRPGTWRIEARDGARTSGRVTVEVALDAEAEASVHVH